MSKKQLHDVLLQSGIVNEGELRAAEAEKSRWGDRLERALIELNLVQESELIPIIGELINVAPVMLSDKTVDEEALRLLDEEFCRRNECIAFEYSEGKRFLHVAMVEPNDIELFDQIRVKTQCNVRPFLAGPNDIQETLTRTLRGDRELSPKLQYSLMSEALLDLNAGDPDDDPEEPTNVSETPHIDVETETESPITMVMSPPSMPELPADASSGELARLRHDLHQFMERTDRFLHALTWHLSRALPPALVAGNVVPYPGGHTPREAAAPVPPRHPTGPVRPVTRSPEPVTPGARQSAAMRPVEPPSAPVATRQSARSVEPAPHPRQSASMRPVEPPSAPVATRQPGRPVEPPGAAVATRQSSPPPRPVQHSPSPSPSGMLEIDALPPQITFHEEIVVDRPPEEEPDGMLVDRPPDELRRTPEEAPRHSAVVTSSGASSAVASGEISIAAPADPSAASAVLLETPETVDHPVVAMDFGTTRSSVAMLVDNRVEVMRLPKVAVLRLPSGEWDMPSAVGFRHDGSVVLGQAARNMLATDPSSAIMSPKRLLGRSFDDAAIQPLLANMAVSTAAGPSGDVLLRVRQREITIIEVCAHILNLLKLVAQRNLRQEVQDVVLSTPVAFGEPQRAALRRAATIVGLNVLGLIEEPVAAALSNRYDEHFRGKVGVYDFGGGTFDFSVVEMVQGRLQVLARSGDAWLGGDDVDEVVASAAANAFWRETGVELRNQVTQWQRLLVASELAKRELSLRNETVVRLPGAALTSKGPYDLSFPLSRSLFARLCQEIIKRSLDTCQAALDQAQLRISDLNALFVSGGTSYIPAVQQALVQYFGKVPRSAVPPERAVIVGAAIHQAFLASSARLAVLQ